MRIQYMWHKIVLVCLLGTPVVVAIVSAVIGYLTLTQDGQVDQPYVPTVRVVVGSLQFVVTGAAILSVMCAALGLKPGGSCLLLVYTLMMASMVVFQLAFTSVLLGLVYAPQEVPAYTRHQLTVSLESDNIELINRVQINCFCCGVDNYSDWANTIWSRDNPGAYAPVSCCNNGIQDNCSMALDSIHKEGCLTKVMNVIHINAICVAVATGILVLIEGMAASVSGHLYRTLVKYSKYNVL